MSRFQAMTQAMLATAFIFAASIGYWSVNHFQTPSADEVRCLGVSDVKCGPAINAAVTGQTDQAAKLDADATGVNLGRVLLIATALSLVVSAVLLRRTLTTDE